eukprot:148444-Chlamydomonas_euryale.AAC.3
MQALVAQHTPDGALEEEVAALLAAAGATSGRSVSETEEKLALRQLTPEEMAARRERLAKMRALMFYSEQKAKRLKGIKSKGYHRRLLKAEKRKGGGGDGGGDGGSDDERAAAAEAEFTRAKERLTLRHRNSSKWARRALKRGMPALDEGTKEALAEQLRLGQELRRKIEGRGADGSSADSASDATEASDGEAAGAIGAGTSHTGRMSAKAKAAALEILTGDGDGSGGPELPSKGLFSLPFMARAIERQRLEAKEQAQVRGSHSPGKPRVLWSHERWGLWSHGRWGLWSHGRWVLWSHERWGLWSHEC